jgi:NADH-quinone oxidoreductase subunit J
VVELVVFFLMGGAAILGALTVIRARNPVYAAMGLLATLFSIGVLYVLNLAHFVAAVQVIVYAGAVMTLFLFVIMLIGVDKAENLGETIPHQRRLAMALGLVAIGIGVTLVARGRFSWVPVVATSADIQATNGTIQAIAEPLFRDWVLAFEATALLLTIAAAGAIALASHRRPGVGPDPEKAGPEKASPEKVTQETGVQ